MKLFNKNINKEILYVAEIGVNHEGSISRCKKLIKDAKNSGANVVKFQCYSPKFYVSKEEEKFKRVKKFYISETRFNQIIKYCKKLKIPYLFTPLSHDWLSFIKKNSNVVKIASGDLNFDFLLKEVLKFNLKIILSTGISNLDEIKRAIKIIKKKYKGGINKKLVLLHCISNYPVKDSDANIKSITFLRDKLNLNVGYSNHVIDINACLSAICLGAKVIEFHFTDNKKRKFRDHQLSLDKLDVKKLIKLGNLFNKLLGKYDKEVKLNSKNDKKTLSKGIIFSQDLKKNHKIKITDLSFARPAKYFFANDIKKILGKKLKKSVKDGFLVKRTDLL